MNRSPHRIGLMIYYIIMIIYYCVEIVHQNTDTNINYYKLGYYPKQS